MEEKEKKPDGAKQLRKRQHIKWKQRWAKWKLACDSTPDRTKKWMVAGLVAVCVAIWFLYPYASEWVRYQIDLRELHSVEQDFLRKALITEEERFPQELLSRLYNAYKNQDAMEQKEIISQMELKLISHAEQMFDMEITSVPLVEMSERDIEVRLHFDTYACSYYYTFATGTQGKILRYGEPNRVFAMYSLNEDNTLNIYRNTTTRDLPTIQIPTAVYHEFMHAYENGEIKDSGLTVKSLERFSRRK